MFACCVHRLLGGQECDAGPGEGVGCWLVGGLACELGVRGGGGRGAFQKNSSAAATEMQRGRISGCVSGTRASRVRKGTMATCVQLAVKYKAVNPAQETTGCLQFTEVRNLRGASCAPYAPVCPEPLRTAEVRG